MSIWYFGHFGLRPEKWIALKSIGYGQTQQQMEHTENINKSRFWVLKGLMGLSHVFGPGDGIQIMLGGSWESLIFELAKLHGAVWKTALVEIKSDFTSLEVQRFCQKGSRDAVIPHRSLISRFLSLIFQPRAGMRFPDPWEPHQLLPNSPKSREEEQHWNHGAVQNLLLLVHKLNFSTPKEVL